MRHLKSILLTSFLYGLAMAVMWANHHGLGRSVLLGALQGACFGGAMVLFIWFMDRRRRKAGRPVDVPVRAAQALTVEAPVDLVREAVILALQGLKKAKPVTEEGAALRTEVGLNWLTWGDVVTARLEGEAKGRTSVRILSVPKVKTTLIDYGKNADNVEAVVAALRARFPGKVEASPRRAAAPGAAGGRP